jgi:drug/metabolite transporter (DMT)-like permease
MSATSAVFFSESVLSLYPILIKRVPTNLNTQTLSRFLVYPLAALIVSGLGPLKAAYSHGFAKNIGLGAINVAHIASSYLAFKELPAGIAMSLFYTYPLWNLFGAAIFFGEAFPWHLFPVVIIALVGATLVAFSRTPEEKSKNKPLNLKGITAALIAALTETAIFLAVKGAGAATSPFTSVHQIYLGGLPILAAYLFFQSDKPEEKIDSSIKNWLPLILFNGLLGFTGYCLRFWSIPRLSTILYSILSMFGVLAAFTWGHFLADEQIQGQGLLGAGILTAAIGYLRYVTH